MPIKERCNEVKMIEVLCVLISDDKTIEDKIKPYNIKVFDKKEDVKQVIEMLSKDFVHLIIIDISFLKQPHNDFFTKIKNYLKNEKILHLPKIFVIYDKSDFELRSRIWQEDGVVGYSSKQKDETWNDIKKILCDLRERIDEENKAEKIEIGSVELIEPEKYERLKFVSLTTGSMRNFMLTFKKLMEEVRGNVKREDVFLGLSPEKWLDWMYYKDAPFHEDSERKEQKKREQEIKEALKDKANNPIKEFYSIFCNHNAVVNTKRNHILIEGETGTGKSLLADLIAKFAFGDTTAPNFQKITATNIPSNMLEGELFGSMRGSYTGAYETKAGKLLKAYNGIVFIDEIGDLEPKLQAKLLTFLDYGLIEPMGWNGPAIYVPTTVIAATNKNLLYMAKHKEFREDLYYRFSRKLYIPPLRERNGDMDVLVDFILQNPKINPDVDGQRLVKYITKEAIEKVKSYIYPGNFRELETVLLEAVDKARQYGSDTIIDNDIVFGEISIEEHEAVFLIIKLKEDEKTKFLLRWDIPHKQYFFIGGRLEPDKEYYHEKTLFRELELKTGLKENDIEIHYPPFYLDSIQQPKQFHDRKLYHFCFYGLKSIKKEAWQRLNSLEVVKVTEDDIVQLQYAGKKISPLVKEIMLRCKEHIEAIPFVDIKEIA
ncbi:MAG: sigma 54-interacting transcriptional regulator [Thermodesulfovibrionales bacterium]|nr:sigma 54-interacting transcriptional regulator [Thermodesulfovibrionales bacterium]